MKNYIPRWGDIVEINFTPQAGREQAGKRPAIIISKDDYNKKTGLCVVCPITSKIKDYPFEVILPEGLNTYGVILSDQIKSLDWQQRKIKYIEHVPEIILRQTLEKLILLLQY